MFGNVGNFFILGQLLLYRTGIPTVSGFEICGTIKKFAYIKKFTYLCQ